jgi:hypothetical protein
MRTYVREHPGRYAAVNSAHPDGPDDPFILARDRLLASFAAVLRGYRLLARQGETEVPAVPLEEAD